MSSTKAFVTGANGFIGSYLVKLLAEKGIRTTAFILKGTHCDFLKSLYPSLANVTIVEGNILDNKKLETEIAGMDYVIHLAGVVQGYKQRDYDRINVIGTKNLLEACLKNNSATSRIVLASSTSAVGFGTPEKPLTEESFMNPIQNDYYGISKYRMEQLAAQYKEKLPLTIFRPCAVMGPGNLVNFDSYTMVKSGFRFNFVGPYRPVSIIDVEDLVEGIYLCAVTNEAVGETFHFSSAYTISVAEMQELVNSVIFGRKYGSLIGIPVTPLFFKLYAMALEFVSKVKKEPAPFINQAKTLAVFAPGQVSSATKAREILGWKPKRTLVEIISREGNWFINNGWLAR